MCVYYNVLTIRLINVYHKIVLRVKFNGVLYD